MTYKTYNFKRFDNGRLAYETEVDGLMMVTEIRTFTREGGYKTLVKDEKNGIAMIINEAKGKIMQWTRIEEGV